MSTQTDAAPSDGALSIDQAVGLLGASAATEVHEDGGAQTPEQDNPPAQPAAEEEQAGAETPTGEEAGEQESAPEEGEGESEPATPAIEPPPFWSAEDKAEFATWSPEQQAKVKAFEDRRNAATAKALQDAATARKAAEAEGEGFRALAQQTQSAVEQAKAAFGRPIHDLLDAEGRPMTWDQVDWDVWAQTDPHTAAAFKLRYDLECAKLERIEAANQQAQKAAQDQAFKAYTDEQGQVLAQIAPHLTDPAKRSDVDKYLIAEGVPPEAVRGVGAVALKLAEKAMLYDRAQAALKASKPKPAPTPPPPSKPVKPAAGAPPTQQHSATVAKNRFDQTKSVEDAVALLRSRKG